MNSNVKQTRIDLLFFYVAVGFSFFAWDIYYLTVSEWIISGIVLYNFLFRLSYLKSIKLIDFWIILFWGLYIIGSIATFYNANIFLTYGQQFLLPMYHSGILPLFLFFCIFALIKNQHQSESLLRCSVLSLLGFFLLIYLGFLFGYATPINDISVVEGDQITVDLKLGGIEFATYATWIGAMTALVFSPLVIFYIKSIGYQKPLWLFLIFLDLILFSRALTRGGGLGMFAGIVVGAVLMNIYVKKYRKKIIFLSLILAMATAVGWSNLTNMLPEGGKRAYQTFFEEGLNVPNILFRFALFSNAYEHAFMNIFGMGFNTLWVYYMIDEVNFYAWSANGTGIFGIVAIWSLFLILTLRFLHIVRKHNLKTKFYGILGLMTLSTVGVAAFGNDQILHRPQSVIPFWVIMAVCFKAADIQSNDRQ